MISVAVSIGNLDALVARFSAAASRLDDTLDEAVDAAAAAVRDHTKLMSPVSSKTTGYGAIGIPVDTGLMRQSIQKTKQQRLAAGVVAATNYSGFVQSGTSRMPARPFFEWSLETGGTELIRSVFSEHISRLLSA